MKTALDSGEVHVWYQTTDAFGESDLKQAVAVLSQDERLRQNRFTFARDRRDYAAAHALLRRSLSRYVDLPPASWQFLVKPGGKPFADPQLDLPPLSFNLSHTHGLVACAIAAGSDVGVDVESVDRATEPGIERQYFSETEKTDLRNSVSPVQLSQRFCELWTLKEAYIKAIGEGLSHPLNTIVFEIKNDGSIAFKPPAGVEAASWQFGLFAPTEQHRLAVAVRCQHNAAASIRLMTGDDARTLTSPPPDDHRR
jgi:4'-phosphopantetheinyl transferase